MCLKKANLTTNVTWGPYLPTELDESSHDNTPTPGPAPAHIPNPYHAPANSRVAHDMSDNIPFIFCIIICMNIIMKKLLITHMYPCNTIQKS